MTSSLRTSLAMVSGILLFSSPMNAAEKNFPLINSKGEPCAITAPPLESLDPAVEELASNLEKLTGKAFPVRRTDEKATGGIILNPNAGPETEGAYQLTVSPQKVEIAAQSADGILFGAVEILEQLGFRWFFPGEIGTVTPHSEHPALAVQSVTHTPSFAARHFGPVGNPQWTKRMRMGGVFFPPAHGIRLGKEITFENHPEYFALIDGKRVKRQTCVSNPEVIKLAAAQAAKYFDAHPDRDYYGMGPNDGGGFCECDQCTALDSGEWDYFSGERSVTDRYIWFFNQVLDELDKTHPGKHIAFYAYHTYMMPPTKVVPNQRITPALAPIALCRVHGMNNPVCPDRAYYKTLMEGWGKLLPQVFERGYWFNLADPGMPFSSVHRMRDEIPQAKKYGIYGWRVETMPHWATDMLSLYVASRLMWDVNADVEAIRGDFCEKFFGPAAGPMLAYFEALDHDLETSDSHSGSAFDALVRYPKSFRDSARKDINQAISLAKEEPYKTRVHLVDLGFQYLETFAAMLEARNAQDWDTAMAQLKKFDAIREKLVAFDPPMLAPKPSASYTQRFFRTPIEEGWQITHEGNKLVAPLKDDWKFLIDPPKLGEQLGYFRRELTGGNWQDSKPYSTTWSGIGLHYYKGLAWYRQSVPISEEWKGKRVFLWLGGVDETAKVWVNGREAGISPISSFTPFELDVTDLIEPGKENVVAVCVANNAVDELGTGGITAPALFYAPAAGKDAQLSNKRPLRSTFP